MKVTKAPAQSQIEISLSTPPKPKMPPRKSGSAKTLRHFDSFKALKLPETSMKSNDSFVVAIKKSDIAAKAIFKGEDGFVLPSTY